MAKPEIVFLCRECGGESLRWAGRCPHCGEWNTLEEYKPGPRRAGRRSSLKAGTERSLAVPVPVTEVDLGAFERRPLEWDEVNRVLGGGVVPGSLLLLGGEPGIGKSTLLMHLASQVAKTGSTVLYSSGEESAQQVSLRARRLGVALPDLLLLAETDLEAIVDSIAHTKPALAVVDSIQTVQDPGIEGAPGSVVQVREAAGRLLRVAKDTGIPIVLVGHVTKEGAIAGPRLLEHMVDTVLYLEGDRGNDFRILRAQKNRFGSTDEIGIFAMGESGFHEVPDPSAHLLSDVGAVPGTAVVAAMEGSRPLLLEIQSLVSYTQFPMPRRAATGLDVNRVHMIVAVLEKRARLALAKMDVLVNVAGGVRVQETAADLGLALAIAGSLRDRALPADTVCLGEVGLAGEVRRVSRLERRLQEAARRGFRHAIVPPGGAVPAWAVGMKGSEVKDLAQAVEVAFGPGLQAAG
ncbi:MAG: DNA repair protein RadA [Candidatus Dormibacter sp.]|uniref:DNA repair protein RadA n=1 Tax=Candidatus Dormibacter sp. TaxID=2973982 RepID=UPI000DB06687|nr:MAG: DNA repair protein RadA [Candidatus Dormibacteraeota bacterium]